MGAATSEYEATLRAHITSYAGFAENWGPALEGAGRPDGGRAQLEAQQRWRIEHDNLLVAQTNGIATGAWDSLVPLARHWKVAVKLSSHYQALKGISAAFVNAAEAAGQHQLELEGSIGLARAEYYLGDAAKSDRLIERQLTLAAELGDRLNEAAVLMSRGTLLLNTGYPDAALGFFEQALAIFAQLGDVGHSLRAICLSNIGGAEVSLERFATARQSYQSSLELSAAIGDLFNQAWTETQFGILENIEGRLEKAHELHTQALEKRLLLGDQFGVAVSLGNRAWCSYAEQGNFEAARSEFLTVLRIFQDLGIKVQEALSWANLAEVNLALKDYGGAREAGERAVALYNQLDMTASTAGTLSTILLVQRLAGADSAPTLSRLLALGKPDREEWFSYCLNTIPLCGLAGDWATGAKLHAGLKQHYRARLAWSARCTLAVWDEACHGPVARGEVSMAELDQWTSQGMALKEPQLLDLAWEWLENQAFD